MMYFGIYLPIFLSITFTKGDATNNVTVAEISDKIVKMFGVNHNKGRIKELEEKIKKINSYVVDNDLVADILKNVTKETNLTETNFYEALNENDHFRFLTMNDTKNLYLKLKAKMNRDDILSILAKRGDNGKLKKSARRMMSDRPKTYDEERVSDVVDKLIAEVPIDNHKEKAKESIYWDPKEELEDLKEYHEAKRDGRRIYKGERTNIRDYPFMASIHIMGRFWCGGVLYWHDLVLTSASCLQLMHNNRFFRENPRVIQVRVGSNHSRIGGEAIEVLEVYFNPSYDPKTLKNNLAIIRLRNQLVFTYHRIPKIIAISDLPTLVPITAEVLVLGWGVTKMTQRLAYEPIFLQKKHLPVYPNHFCKEVYGDKFITGNMFCAGTLTTGEGACDHDAGGPAIMGGRLVGIISFGPATCGYANAPTVFTLVGAFSDWIETVNETMPSYYRYKAKSTLSTKSDIQEYVRTWRPPRQTKEILEDKTKIYPILTPLEITLGETVVDAPMIVTPEPTVKVTVEVTPEVEEVTITPSPTTPPALRNEESDGGWSIEDNK